MIKTYKMSYGDRVNDDAKTPSPRGQATIDKILDSTLEFIQRDGIARLTTNHIARESGVKVGSIYHFFPNKEAILLELVRRWQAQIQAGIRLYLEELEPDTSLTKLTIGIVMQNLEGEYAYSAAFDEIAATGSIQPALGDLFDKHLETVADMIADHYMQNPNRPSGAKKKQIIEYCLFLHPVLTMGLSLVAEKKGRSRDRHLHWLNAVIKGAVNAFEESLKNTTHKKNTHL